MGIEFSKYFDAKPSRPNLLVLYCYHWSSPKNGPPDSMGNCLIVPTQPSRLIVPNESYQNPGAPPDTDAMAGGEDKIRVWLPYKEKNLYGKDLHPGILNREKHLRASWGSLPVPSVKR